MDPTAAATVVASKREEILLPYVVHRSRTNKSTGPASVVEGSVPIIDLEGLYDLDRRFSTINLIGEACANYGFFLVKNHGVPEPISSKMFQTATDFFHLPEEEKMKFDINDRLEKVKDQESIRNKMSQATRDFFHLPEQEKMKLSIADRFKKIRYIPCSRFFAGTSPAKNISWRTALAFPVDDDTEKYPANPPSYKEDVAAYFASMQVLVDTVVDAISESLGMEKDYLTKTIKKNLLSASTNYYPICPNPEKHVGAMAHSDGSLITVIQQVDPGLQFDYNGTWLPIEPIPGTLCINVGDILQILSNDRYRSMCHRVNANAQKERVSIATFCFPSYDVVLGPAKKLVDQEHPPQHSYFTFDQYIGSFLKRGLSNCV